MNKQKPNILLICSDQHNPSVAGCYGDKIIETSNLDRLSAEGVTFDSAYCNSPLCVPSRMSFLTGLYPFNNNAISNGCTLESIIPTYAHMAAAEGYHTVLSGRMHFKGPDQRHGFIERLVGEIDPYFYWSASRERLAPLEGELGNMSKPDPLTVAGAGNTCYIDHDKAVTEKTCAWLESYSKGDNRRPFMMTAGYITPHCPYISPPELFDKYRDSVRLKEISEEEYSKLHQSHKDYIHNVKIDSVPLERRLRAKTAYYGLVDFLDAQIGALMDTLKKNGLLDNTIVVYFSDHGDLIGEHGRWHKGCFFEGSIRVPLIVRMPDRSNAGKRVKENVSLVDLFPTVCEWVNADIPHPVDGSTLGPFINGEKSRWDDTVKAEYYHRDCRRMIRKGPWKLNYYSNYDFNELFNLDKDPAELENLSGVPGFEEIEKELMGLVFSDGWNDDVLKKNDEKLIRYGYYKTILGKFAANFAKDTEYLDSAPDFWAGSRKCRNWVRE